MIEIKQLEKNFGTKKALAGISFTINEGTIFGLVGSNGAGKSTLLRVLAGVYQADGGVALLGGQSPFENVAVKSTVLFISDYPYFFPQSTITSLSRYYKAVYPNWSEEKFAQYCKMFPLDVKMKIRNMSKGMQRQAALVLGLSTCPKYILFDEIFDGLDPVIREVLKRILVEFVAEEQATVLIASHNLRELEELCDHVGLLHDGGVIFERELDELKLGIHRVQMVLQDEVDFEKIKTEMEVLKSNKAGKVFTFTAKGSSEEIMAVLNPYNPLLCEVLPLTLEEVFISEMEGVGYDINKIIQ